MHGSLKHFANGKVWVGTDNQVHDVPLSQLHNTEYVHVRIRMLKFEQYKIESESIFNGNCVPELYILTTQVDE